MSQAEFAVNFFVALFALIDPVGNVPLFAAGTVGATTRDRARVALYVSLFVFGLLTLFYFSGLALLQFFGISLPAFRIAGGVILLLMGLDMARNETPPHAESAAVIPETGEERRRFEDAGERRRQRLEMKARTSTQG